MDEPTQPPPMQHLMDAGYPGIDLPLIGDRVPLGMVRGRSVHEGYVRGWGLEYGGIDAQIAGHPLYREALAASRGRSVMHEHRLMNLFLIVTCYLRNLSSQNIIEFGSYRGGSALFLAYLLKRLYPGASVYALDTFEGMPAVDSQSDLHAAGDFADADLPGLQQAREQLGLSRLQLVPGLVQDTFPRAIPAGVRFGLAHFDMDIYEPTAFAQVAAWPLMCGAAYYVYDDATVSSCIGATQAVEELIHARRLHSEQVYPHFVFRVREENS